MTSSIEPFRRNDRAVSVAVTHVLAIGITTILIVGLLTAAGGLAEDEQDQSTREQLRMIGSSMANQIEQADQLGRKGANVSVRKEFEGTIAGGAYTVSLHTGGECKDATLDTDTCLVLDSLNSDISATVGVNNRSPVTFDYLGSGTIEISSEASKASNTPPLNPGLVEQVGVGGSVYNLAPSTGKKVAVTLPPVAKFDVESGSVEYMEVVLLNASESYDRDGGSIVEYKWDLDDDGNFEQNTTAPTMGFLADDPYKGRNTVNLKVVDDEAETNSTDNSFKVSAVVLDDSKGSRPTARDYDGDGTTGGLNFWVENLHNNDVTIRSIRIDPWDDDIDRLKDERIPDYGFGWHEFHHGQAEIFIEDESGSPTSWIDYHSDHDAWDDDDSGRWIPDPGLIQHFEDSGASQWDNNGGDFPLDSGGKANISLAEFQKGANEIDMSSENVTMGVRYTIGDYEYGSTFVVNPLRPYVDRHDSNIHKQIKGNQPTTGVKIKPSKTNTDIPVRSDWDIVANPYNINITTDDRHDKNDKWRTRTINLTDGSTPIDPTIEDKYIIIEVTVTDDYGSNTFRYIIEVNDTDGSSD
jgi:hypothetical protein